MEAASAHAWSLRRVHTPDDALVEALADVLIDCVEGGASVSFMRPLTRARGDIPSYALYPEGDFCSTTVFFKDLSTQAT